MGLEVEGLMHVGYRIGAQADQVPAIAAFYKSVFDLDIDPNRPTIPKIPGAWIQLPNSSVKPQFHLIVADGVSPAARSARQDPTRTHIALVVKDLAGAKTHLEAVGVDYWVYEGLVGMNSDQVFFEDPTGNLFELQQIG
jgi:catechol 2,3-dioxygenase-like lactoylglutathione lyase family enzyme